MSFRICNGHRGWFCQDGIRSQRRLATQLKGEHSSSEKETLYCGNMGQVPLVAFSTFFSVKGAQDKPFPSVLGPPQEPSVGGNRIPWYHWSLTSLGFVSLLSLTVVKITSRWSFLDHWTVEHLSPVEMSTNFIKKIGPTTWSPGSRVDLLPVDVEEGEDIEFLACAEQSRWYVVSCQHYVARRTERI